MNDNKQWHGGKGSQRRGDNDEVYRSNWDRIFGGIDYTTVDHLKEKVGTVDKSDDKNKNNMGKLYHSAKEGIGLQRPQDFDNIDPYTVLTDNKSFNNNGDNK